MSANDYTGQTIDGKYEIVRMLGKGGMGAVYLGQHVVIDKKVAIKFLHGDMAQSESVIKRFYREAQAAASIGHKSIIDVIDVGVSPNKDPYLIMEYLEGESLGSLLERAGPLDLAAACGILEPVLLALEVVHAKGIVHRDLKPDNIFLAQSPGEASCVKLIDFGISKFTQDTEQTSLTGTGTMIGTPAYMAPEQAKGARDIDHRADLFAVGVILYEMLAGDLPFVGDHYTALVLNLMTAPPRDPRELNKNFPMEAEPLIMRSLAKNPDDRYQSATNMLNAIKKLSGYARRGESLARFASSITEKMIAGGDLGQPVESEQRSRSAEEVLSDISRLNTQNAWADTEITPPKNKNKWIAGGLVLVIVILAGVAFMLMRPRTESPSRETAPTVAPQQTERVQITLTGVPSGAAVYFGDAQVLVNPFKADKGDQPVALRVEAEGYAAFTQEIAPTQDRTVAVAMTKLESRRPRSTGRRTRQKPQAVPVESKQEPKAAPAKAEGEPALVISPVAKEPEKKPQKKPPPEDNKFYEAGRGTQFAKDFDE